MSLRSVSLVAALLVGAQALAVTTEVGPGDDLASAINALNPGDELIMRGGTYDLTGRLSISIAGTANAPILIRAKVGEQPHLHRPNADQNIIDFDSAEHVILRGIEFSGGSAGVRLGAARSFTVEDCEIHDTGDVALRANDRNGGQTYEGLRILRNHIHHTHGTGEGMYLGCNEDGCRLANSLIEGNYVHHTGLDVDSQGDGIELKEGSHDCVIRDNVIHDTKYPCILTYSAVGNGGPNLIERNAMWGCGNHAIQSAADTTIRNNLILGSGADGIAMQPHQNGSPSNLVVVHNTVLHPSNDAVTLRGTSGSVLIANNALYAQNGRALYANGGDLGQTTVVGNAGVGSVQGFSTTLIGGDLSADLVSASYAGLPPMDLFPATGGALPAAGETAHVTADDFNGTARAGVADVGAYVHDSQGNPGWALAAGFKGETPVVERDAGARDGAVVTDSSTPARDSSSGSDSASPTRDGGAGNDSAVPIRDGSAGQDTSGAPMIDASPVDIGAGSTDGGSDGATAEGCGCGLSAAPRAIWLPILLLWLGYRRRKAENR